MKTKGIMAVLAMAIVGVACATSVASAVTPSALFSDHAVLLKSPSTPVFGFAAPGEKVAVSVAGVESSAVAGADGKWIVRLALSSAGRGPHAMRIGDKTFGDVVVGEVWLASGQSNMSFKMHEADDADMECEIENPGVRCFVVTDGIAERPNDRISGQWWLSGRGRTSGMTAVGYHFAKNLNRALGCPVGIVEAAVGASSIESWRRIFGKPELPFGWCQLAGWKHKVRDPNVIYPSGTDWDWPRLRMAQDRALRLPMTGQAVLIDAGEAADIHPRDKRTPGARLAAWALATVYGKTDVPYLGPRVAKAEPTCGTMVVTFTDCGGGLEARALADNYPERTKEGKFAPLVRNSPNAQVEGFSLAGADGKWHWADEATISGDKVIVSAKAVPNPVKVRYAYAINPVANLYNKEGFPAVPFGD